MSFCPQGEGVSARHPLGRHPPGGRPHADTPRADTSWADIPPADGYCSGRYASYWNAFFFIQSEHWNMSNLVRFSETSPEIFSIWRAKTALLRISNDFLNYLNYLDCHNFKSWLKHLPNNIEWFYDKNLCSRSIMEPLSSPTICSQ